MSAVRSKQDFDRYLEAFNKSDTEVYTAFYTDDAEMALGDFVFKGKQQIRDFFKASRISIAEHLTIESFILDKNAISVRANITFTAKENLTEPFAGLGPVVNKGGGYNATFVVYYQLNALGVMEKIHCGRATPTQTFNGPRL